MGDLKVYTANEVCELLKITKRTLYRYVEDGSITGFRAGRQYRFTEDDIKDFIEARRGARPRRRKTTEGQ
jgi:excisionase family DNA binding protein